MIATVATAVEATDVILRDGSTLRLRAPVAEDADALLEFFSDLSEHSRYLRFHGFPALGPKLVEPVLAPDWQERGRCSGRWTAASWPSRTGSGCATRAPRRSPSPSATSSSGAESGRACSSSSRPGPREAGIEEFVAEVLHDNARMLGVFRDAGFAVTRAGEGGELEIRFAIAPTDTYREHVAERDHVAVRASLEPFFQPRSVAVVGASKRRGSIGGELFRNILTGDFAGSVYPVNRKGDSVAGVHGYGAVGEIAEAVDLAVICLPGELVLDAAEEALAAGVRALVVISAGFAETGSEGTERQERLLALVREHGARLLGPNCLGIASTAVRLNATFAPRSFPAGKIGFSSQSGALGLALLERAEATGLGVTSFVSVGNKADVSSNDLLEWWEDDDATEMVILYLESFGNPRAFSRIARRLARRKPILALKGGSTRAGSRAAGSHTAALAGSDVAVDALFRQAGVIRARTLDELIDVATLLSAQPVPRGRRVALVTNAGGLGDPRRGRVRGRRARAAAARRGDPGRARRGHAAGGERCEPDRHARWRERGELRAGAASGARRSRLRCRDRPLRPDRRDGRGEGRRGDQPGCGEQRTDKPVLCVFVSAKGAPPSLRSAANVPSFAYPEAAARALGRAAERGEWLRQPAGVVPELECDRDAGRAVVREAVTGGERMARRRADAPPARGVRRPARARARRGHDAGGRRGGKRARLPGRAQDGRPRRAQDRAGRHRPRPRATRRPSSTLPSGSALRCSCSRSSEAAPSSWPAPCRIPSSARSSRSARAASSPS